MLKLWTAVFSVLFLMQPAQAGDKLSINPAHVLDVLTADWNGDGGKDRAVLVAGEEGADIYLYLSVSGAGMQFKTHKADIAWHGAMWGTQPSLGQSPNDRSFFIHSQNESIGRHRWYNKLTITVQDDQFIVAGYTHNSFDTLDLGIRFECDVNLLTGNGIRNNQLFKVPATRTEIAHWSRKLVPSECNER